MQSEVMYSPAFATAKLTLAAGESVRAESGAMLAMSAGIAMETSTQGGVLKGLKRSLLGGESFFMGKYTAEVHSAWVGVASKYPGDAPCLDLDGEGMRIETGALLAVSEGVSVDVKYAGLGNIVIREGATMLHVDGIGKVVIGTYGGIQRFELNEGEEMIIDTGHLVGVADTVKMRVGPLSSVSTAVFTGEGLVARMLGPGTVIMQTRAEQSFREWLMIGDSRAQNTGRV